MTATKDTRSRRGRRQHQRRYVAVPRARIAPRRTCRRSLRPSRTPGRGGRPASSPVELWTPVWRSVVVLGEAGRVMFADSRSVQARAAEPPYGWRSGRDDQSARRPRRHRRDREHAAGQDGVRTGSQAHNRKPCQRAPTLQVGQPARTRGSTVELRSPRSVSTGAGSRGTGVAWRRSRAPEPGTMSCGRSCLLAVARACSRHGRARAQPLPPFLGCRTASQDEVRASRRRRGRRATGAARGRSRDVGAAPAGRGACHSPLRPVARVPQVYGQSAGALDQHARARELEVLPLECYGAITDREFGRAHPSSRVLTRCAARHSSPGSPADEVARQHAIVRDEFRRDEPWRRSVATVAAEPRPSPLREAIRLAVLARVSPLGRARLSRSTLGGLRRAGRVRRSGIR